MDWSVQEIARAAGTTSRTLRHYDHIGVLPPTRVGHNGYRYYDEHALVRLQRILLLRGLGLDLPTIRELLTGQQDVCAALREHAELLRGERERIARQLTSVQSTLQKLTEGQELMPTDMFDGFDHTQYRGEVIERWGQQAWDRGAAWWETKTPEQRDQFQQQHLAISQDFAAALEQGLAADSDHTQEITRRQHQWVTSAYHDDTLTAEAYRGLGQMYVDDERFAAAYGGVEVARYVRDAIHVFAQREL